MRYILLILTVSVIMACGTSSEVATGNTFGEALSADQIYSMSDLNLKMSDQIQLGKIKVKGDVEAVCKKKGCWMTIKNPEGEAMRVTFKDYGFFVPLDCDGKSAIFEGKAYVTETSVADLRHYAEDEGLAQEEINKITEPKRELTFEATGVEIL